MEKTILKYLEKIVEEYPNKQAFTCGKDEINYYDFLQRSKRMGTVIAKKNNFKKPIAILLDKNIDCLVAMIGTLYSGNFYTILDIKSPIDRLEQIVDTLEPVSIIVDSKTCGLLEKFKSNYNSINVDEIHESIEIEEDLLKQVENKVIDTDIMYILFTSGSTGIPKGAVLTHKAVLSYVSWFKDCFEITSDTVFGSQTPFYFSMSVSDVFSTMITGATFHIIPKMYFSFPVKLLNFLNEKKVNTIYWVPSALSIVANFKTLDEVELPYLKKVLFAGEVMPTKQLNMWIEKVDAMYANLYGPTETVDICTYYKIDRKLASDEPVPIGHNCDNCDVLLIKEDNTLAKDGELGELYVRGSFLASGYYKNTEKTNASFVINPLNNNYPEILYKTGDIVKYNELGELIYVCRKDYQIKHMGYRIELGEIETKISAIDGVGLCCSLYIDEEDKIILYYQSDQLDDIVLIERIKSVLPKYMVPNIVKRVKLMPYNANGKIDRKKLKKDYLSIRGIEDGETN